MGASTAVMGAAAATHHHTPCFALLNAGVARGRGGLQLRTHAAGDCSGRQCGRAWVSRDSRLYAKEYQCSFRALSRTRISSEFQERSCTDVPRKSAIAAASKSNRQRQSSKKPQKSSSMGGLTKDEAENGVLDLLDLGLNGNWLYKDDEFDELDDAPFLDAVVKVYCTRSEPNFSLPWQKMRQYSVTGSGFMISGRRLLTNAHCVEHHTQVKVKRRGIDTKFVANVLAVGRECDIALLSVSDDEFWGGVEPLEFGGLPRLQDPVTVVGYPIGGETISVTSGVVSRVEITSYAHGATELLAVQIDAAINPGNSGGPAFDEDGECVGIAFQSIDASDAENIGYVIPTPVIMHFLYDYERNGKNTGFPSCGLVWQRLENGALREALQMASNQRVCLLPPFFLWK